MISAFDAYNTGPFKDKITNEKNFSFVKDISSVGTKMSTIQWEMGLRTYSSSTIVEEK